MAKRKSESEEPGPDLAIPSQEYTVLARRYRPQQFSELVGQEPVAKGLMKALESNRVAHAYLFSGVRGVGKTSTARILAKALNCAYGPTVRPCDACSNCLSIALGEDVDVLEIDGASNRGIDQVREIRQNVQYRPSRSRYKIYIVDEVHMLTRDAFNALLKTLEEPPAHVKFILATTEVQKVPATILSRCQRFDFAGIGLSQVVERLRTVIRAEGMNAEDEALELVARRAGGSMRDAQSLLDQLLAFSGGDTLLAEEVHQMLGTAQDERISQLASAVLAHDAENSLDLLRKAGQDGLQLGELLDQFIDYWRDLMVAHCAGIEAQDFSVPARHRQTLLQQATSVGLDTILAGLEILAATKVRMRGSSHARVLVEMALVRLTRLEDLVPLSQLAHSLGNTPAATTSARPPLPRQPSAREASPRTETVKKKPPTDRETVVRVLTPQTLPSIWVEVLQQVGQMLASDLTKAGSPAISGPNNLVLRFPVDYNSEREHCEQSSTLTRIEGVVRKITGQPWKLRIESTGNETAGHSVRQTETKPDSSSRYRRQRAAAAREPVVKRAIDLFGAQLIDVENGFGSDPSAEEA